jgi:hypothetical protein
VSALIAQIFDPNDSWLSRTIALVVIMGVAIFYYMATRSVNGGLSKPDAQREALEAERRAEAIVAAARREEAERIARGEQPPP